MATPAGTNTEVCAVYAPSDVDSPKFFEKAVDAVNKGECSNRLIIGDFNTTMSAKLDQHQYDTDPHQNVENSSLGLNTTNNFLTCSGLDSQRRNPTLGEQMMVKKGPD